MMMKNLVGFLLYGLLVLFLFSSGNCRKSYAPPEINASHKYLSVDGMINMNTHGISSFKITRSQNLSDTVFIPELRATVFIKNTTGMAYPLTDTGSNGIYVSDALSLDPTQQYILSVATADGNQYASDPITPKQAPAIDSVTWTIGFDNVANTDAVNIYVNAHDPSGNTRFYRWDFIETWAHESIHMTNYLVQDKRIVIVYDSAMHNWRCWSTAPSTSILVGSSSGLSADIISRAPITRIYQNDPRMDIKYSILVRQYALDASEYDYWQQVQKQSETLGGLFDIIPAQLTGNMHNQNIPSEPVYGYVSASSVQEKRIFISNQNVGGWQSIRPCRSDQYLVDTPREDSLYYYSNDPEFTFDQFGSLPPAFPGGKKKGPYQISSSLDCLDCTFQGGSTVRPTFWQ